MPIQRRIFLTASLALLSASKTSAADPPATTPYQGVPVWPAPENFLLWPGRAPGERETLPAPDWTIAAPRQELKIQGVDRPAVHVFRAARPTGQGLLVLPGGSYRLLSVQNEGLDAARIFNAMGITVFILTYRLPAEGWDGQSNVPLQDAQRAMRLVRSKATEFGIDPAKLAVLGFSAGGHLAASLTTGYGDAVYDPIDAADRETARPAFSALLYPVIDMRAPLVHAESRRNLLGPEPSEALLDARSPHLHVTPETPPCFLAHALDDGSVPYGNSIAMVNTLRANKVAAELHLFEKGGHGFGFHLPPETTGAHWPELFRAWIAMRA